ncbi:MAG: hypothetical protein WDZ35_05980 [Crocinitomicaceae bacterium]
MKNLLRNSFLGFLVISAMVGCRKDSPVSDDPINNPQDTAIIDSSICGGECEDFPQSPELGWFYQSSGPQYKAPCFNPNNPNEFVFFANGNSSCSRAC